MAHVVNEATMGHNNNVGLGAVNEPSEERPCKNGKLLHTLDLGLLPLHVLVGLDLGEIHIWKALLVKVNARSLATQMYPPLLLIQLICYKSQGLGGSNGSMRGSPQPADYERCQVSLECFVVK
jgi:hypothetical protein